MSRIFVTLLVALSKCHQAPAQALATFVDKNRILLVFAPTDQDPRLREQLNLLSHHAKDMKDRDLILITILSPSGETTPPDTLRTPPRPVLSDAEQLSIRHRFRVPPAEFAAILLGKDGGEKLRSSTPVSCNGLNRTIDAMPMRRQEMRERAPKP